MEDIEIFQTIQPSRFLSFTLIDAEINATPSPIRVAVLDSPVSTDGQHRVAAMFVPKNRQDDWIFNTEAGHLELLLSFPEFQRLILIGEAPISTTATDSASVYIRPTEIQLSKTLQEKLKPLIVNLTPSYCFHDRSFEIPILVYEDILLSSVALEKTVGPFVGEILVEDVEIETAELMGTAPTREFRRRLRFKRMPNLIQTDIRIVPEEEMTSDSSAILRIGGDVNFKPDLSVLVHVYLAPMVAGLALIAPHLEQRIRSGFRPKALCLGVGGGALLGFLSSRLGFQILGVEIDEVVLKVAKKYFGLVENGDFVKLIVGDAVELMEKLAIDADVAKVFHFDAGDISDLDVIMIDLDSRDLINGVAAPPLDIVKKHILLAAQSILSESGIIVINVIPSTSYFYEKLKGEFLEVFSELYEIQVQNEENFVLIAKFLPSRSSVIDGENSFLQRLRSAIPGVYIESIKRIDG